MVYVQVNLRMSPEEKKLLERRAAIEKVSEAEYLRNLVIVDAFICGDMAAAKLVGRKLKEKVLRRLEQWDLAEAS